MKENENLNANEALQASANDLFMLEQFMKDNYLIRKNILSGKVEFTTLPAPEHTVWRPLTMEALNSMVLKARREEVMEKGSPRTLITELVNSEEVAQFNPVQDYLDNLPKWDGQNHVAQLCNRLPGLTSEKQGFMATWLRSVVAHWLQMDNLHGNEEVLTLTGAQGCGKTTYVQRLLPPQLRSYYMDHLNLSNRFDKEMALTNNLLVNLDELETIRPGQHAALKQTLSKSKVNSRPIFGATQDDRPRFASFVATTNDPHPLTDVTGSRRYICLTIPKGQFIDNSGDINYDQLYAQLLHEIRDEKAPYWFNNDEVARIQELNQEYTSACDIAEIVTVCFRKPKEGEDATPMNCTQILKHIRKEYPSVKDSHSAKIRLGLAMNSLGFDYTERSHVPFYKVVPRQTA